MKVLILHQHFNTPDKGGALRSYYLATALVANGIAPIVITAHNDTEYKVIHLEGIEVHALPIQYHNRFGFWKRSISFLRYAWSAFRLARKVGDVKVCYAISVPLTVGLSAQAMKFWYGIPYVFEVGDLWPDAPVQLGFVRNSFVKYILYRIEKSIYEGAEFVVALSSMIQSDIMSKVPGKRVHLIPNMADIDFYRQEVKDPLWENKFGVKGKFVVSYIGAVGLANGLDFFIDCARTSQDGNLPIHFLLCGDGAKLDDLKKAVGQLQLKNFSFIAFQNREGVRAIMNVTDASFICYKSVPVLETGSPNKYFDGLASGKLILVNFGGWIKDEVERQGCGVHIDPKVLGDFVEKISPFIQNGSHLSSFQHEGRLLAETNYSRQMLSKKFAELFSS